MKKPNSPKNKEYVTMSTFEKAMASIARSFARIEEKLSNHDNAFDTIIKMLRGQTEEMREHRNRMDVLESNDIKQEKAIDSLNEKIGIVTIK